MEMSFCWRLFGTVDQGSEGTRMEVKLAWRSTTSRLASFLPVTDMTVLGANQVLLAQLTS